MKTEKKIDSATNFASRNKTALKISEDDRLRSQYIWHIIQEENRVPLRDIELLIPHVLVQFWDNVLSIPSDVRECMNSWKSLEKQGFNYILFDDERAEKFIAENFDSEHLEAFKLCRHPAMRADYFRLCYLLTKGGFYVDADDVYKGGSLEEWFSDNRLKLHPLCYNHSTDSMVETSDFMGNPRDLPELTFYVNNNPIVAPPHHPVLCKALERSTQILLTQIKGSKQDVQATTGPGNLTASLVRHAIETEVEMPSRDFTLNFNWDDISKSQWPLEYRKDKRNWRLWDGCDDWINDARKTDIS